MNEVFKLALSLSLSGSVLAVITFACCRLMGNRLSKRFQYYIWVVVVLRLLLPFSPESGITTGLWASTPPVQDEVQPDSGDAMDLTEAVQPENTAEAKPQPVVPQAAQDRISVSFVLQTLWPHAWILWLAIAAGLMLRKITIYQSYVKYLRAGRAEVDDIKTLDQFAELSERMGVHRIIDLYTNRLIASPLVLGFRKPAVILPKIPDGQEEFRLICLHELTHHKRRDIYYKWLLQLVLCLHWFNPLVHLMVREVNRSCELSCDEAVLQALSTGERRQYGDTLLKSLQTPGTYREGLAALTLSENARTIKERLESIMKFTKPNKATATLAIILAALLFTGGYALGAYSVEPQSASQEENIGFSPEGLPIMSAANREIYETYINKFVVTGLFRADFTPEDPSALIANGGSIMRNVFNVMLDEPLTDIPEAIPASQVVELLTAKLPVNEWTIEAAFADVYDEATDTYELYGGLGGGPSTPIVTGSSRQGELLTVHYTWYDGDPSADEFHYKAGNQGVLIIRLNKKEYQYISNKSIPNDTPPNVITQPETYSEYTFYARTLMGQGETVFDWYYNDTPYDALWISPDAPSLELDGSYYREVIRFKNIEELKAATEAVFTQEFCEANFYPLIEIGKFKEINGVLYVGDQGGVPEGATTPPKEYLLRSVEDDKVVLTAICEGPDPTADNPSNVPLIDYSFELILRNVVLQTENMSPIDCWRADSYYGYNAGGFQGDLQPYE